VNTFATTLQEALTAIAEQDSNLKLIKWVVKTSMNALHRTKVAVTINAAIMKADITAPACLVIDSEMTTKVVKRFIAPRWKRHSEALLPRQPALMIVQISNVTRSAPMGVWLDITWRAELNIWFAS